MRLLTTRNSGVTDLKSLKGKTVAVSDMASPAKNFFSILLAKRGIDPVRDVQWRQYPADLLGIALEKGEAQAAADGDPAPTCCAGAQPGRSGDQPVGRVRQARLLRARHPRQPGARGQGHRRRADACGPAGPDWTVANPEGAARHFAEFAKTSRTDVVAMLKSYTHGHHPVGGDLKKELALYTDELKLVSVIRPGTDSTKFAERIYADVLS